MAGRKSGLPNAESSAVPDWWLNARRPHGLHEMHPVHETPPEMADGAIPLFYVLGPWTVLKPPAPGSFFGAKREQRAYTPRFFNPPGGTPLLAPLFCTNIYHS